MSGSGSLRGLWASLLIIGLLIFGPISFYSLFYLGRGFGSIWGLLGLIPILITVLLILGLVKIFSKKESTKKDYKLEKTLTPMKMHSIFYIVGVIFIFASVWYFAREYIAQFPNSIKLILLVASTIISFVIAEFMRGADK